MKAATAAPNKETGASLPVQAQINGATVQTTTNFDEALLETLEVLRAVLENKAIMSPLLTTDSETKSPIRRTP